jgi:hypothetical protein
VVGASSNQTLTITNSTATTSTLTEIIASGTGFKIKGPSLPLVLNPGESATFTTSFAPTSLGSASGSVAITSSELTSPRVSLASVAATPVVATRLAKITMNGAGVSKAPTITTQPASQTVAVGQTATFSVIASGIGQLSYQWLKNGIAIGGATSATYTTLAATTSDNGSQISVAVSNSKGSTTSDAATLTVTAAPAAPSITTQPASQTVTAGQTATFSVTGSGVAPLSYQWRKNGVAISGATSASYTTPTTTTSDSGSQFNVVVSDSTSSVVSNNATLIVNAAPIAITVNPNNATVTLGSTQQFLGNVTGTSNTAVTWALSGGGCTGAACGTISINGLFVPPASAPSPAVVTVKATSVADPTKSASATVTIVAAAAVFLSLSPTSSSVPTVGTQLFTASVTGTTNTAVTWTLSGAGCSGTSCGTISTSASSGVYSSPAVAPTPPSVNVTAVSVADPTKSASASVTIVSVIAITVGPANATVVTGTTQQFNASVTGTSNTALTWSVTGAGCSGVACGTINTTGLYTAPAAAPSPATVTITATSVADPTKSGAVNLTIGASVKTSVALPTLPQAIVDVTMPIQGGTVRNVSAGNSAGFQTAINAATCGDTIVLAAGSTYSGAFTIPNKICSGWILIVSSALPSLPASGMRVGPSNAVNLAKIVTTTADTSPITFQTSSHNWRLIGLEVTSAAGLHEYSLVETSVSTTQVSQEPSFIIIDRCYVHGAPTSAVRRGFSLQGPSMAVVDSYFSEFHDQISSPGAGADSQAIASWNSPGPVLIQNNFLSAASENTMFGGSDPSITNLVPSDITIVGNWYWKDHANWLGAGMVVKNSAEFKNAQRVLVDGNVFEYSWGDGQDGTAVMFTVRNQDGRCNWCTVQDVTFTHNLIRHAGNGIETTGADSNFPSLPDNRILIQNNVMTDINSVSWIGSGRGLLNLTGSNNIIIDHNSIFANQTCMYLGDSGKIGTLQWTNQICLYGSYGVFGNGVGTGSIAFTTYVTTWVYNDSVLLTAGGSSDGSTWPSATFFNTTAGAQFTDYANANFQLLNGSPYHNAGTDGRDIGVWDWTALNTETTNALNGTYPH